MAQRKFSEIVGLEDQRREEILMSVGLRSDEPLRLAVEAMVAQALTERPTHPNWHPLSGRNAEGIRAVRESLEAHGGWVRYMTRRRLEGAKHIDLGFFVAVHNTCERTGLDGALPRFMSYRNRPATRGVREDLQYDFFDLFEDFSHDEAELSSSDEKNLHLCVYINKEPAETGEEVLFVRAELVIGARCTNEGVVGCKYRLPIDLPDMNPGEVSVAPYSPSSDDAVEANVDIRRKL